jgi:site-specific recombinase XerD
VFQQLVLSGAMARLSHPRLSTAIEQFLHWRERNGWRSDGYGANAATIRSYRAELARFQRFADDIGLGDPYLSDIDREIIERFRISINLGRRVGASDPRPLSLETTKRRLVVLRQLLRYANRQEWLSEDLGASIGIPVPTVLLPRTLRSDHLERLLSQLRASTLKEKRDKAFLLFLLSTGARLSEVLRLDRSDLKPNGLSFPGRPTQRVAVLTKGARRALEAYLTARVDSCPALFIGLQPARQGSGTNRLSPTGAR